MMSPLHHLTSHPSVMAREREPPPEREDQTHLTSSAASDSGS